MQWGVRPLKRELSRATLMWTRRDFTSRKLPGAGLTGSSETIRPLKLTIGREAYRNRFGGATLQCWWGGEGTTHPVLCQRPKEHTHTPHSCNKNGDFVHFHWKSWSWIKLFTPVITSPMGPTCPTMLHQLLGTHLSIPIAINLQFWRLFTTMHNTLVPLHAPPFSGRFKGQLYAFKKKCSTVVWNLEISTSRRRYHICS